MRSKILQDFYQKLASDPERDRAYQLIAEDAYNGILSQLYKMDDSFIKKNFFDGHYTASIEVNNPFTPKILTLQLIPIESAVSMGFQYPSTIYINILSFNIRYRSNLLDPFSKEVSQEALDSMYTLSTFKKILEDSKNIFIHEYIHLLDTHRMQDVNAVLDRNKDTISFISDNENLTNTEKNQKYWEWYTNNTEELNAYFQMDMKELMDFIDKELGYPDSAYDIYEFYEKDLATFNTFKTFLIQVLDLDINFIRKKFDNEYFSKESEQRQLKRLYNWYEYIKEYIKNKLQETY